MQVQKATVNGAHTTQVLQHLLNVFIDKFVLCPKCHLPETALVVKKDGLVLHKCSACGAKEPVDMSHKLCTFILKEVRACVRAACAGRGEAGRATATRSTCVRAPRSSRAAPRAGWPRRSAHPVCPVRSPRDALRRPPHPPRLLQATAATSASAPSKEERRAAKKAAKAAAAASGGAAGAEGGGDKADKKGACVCVGTRS